VHAARPHLLPSRHILLCALLCVAVGCQWSDSRPPAPPPAAPSGPPSLFPTPLDLSQGTTLTVALPLPPAPDFLPLPANSPPDPLLALLPAPHPPIDPCLSTAAALYAAYHPPSPAPEPPLTLLEFLLRSAGCLDSSASVRLFYTTEDGTDGLRAHLQHLSEALSTASFVGLGRAPAPAPYQWTWALLLVDRRFKLLTPLPRTCAPGDTLRAQVEVSDNLKNVELIVMDTSLHLTRTPISTYGSTPINLSIPCTHPPGELWIELLGRGNLGPEVIFQAPIHVGTSPPSTWSGERLQEDPQYTKNPEAAELYMLTLLNEDRRKHHLPPLILDPYLSQIARAHSQEMRDRNFFAHTSPTSGDLSDRLALARYRVRSSTENIARNTSITDAQRGLMQSLGHRINILDPAITHVGLGVAIDPTTPKPLLHITQNFAKPLPPLDLPTFQTQIRSLIPPHLTPPATLSEIAQRAASQIQTHGQFSPPTLNPILQKWLSEAQIPYRSFTLQYQTLLEPQDLTFPTSPRPPSAVAVGFSPPDPQGRFPILLLILHQ
jgi:uncharacterized protein YkwD